MLRRDFLKAATIATAAAPLLSPSTLFAQTTSATNSHVPTILWARRGNDEYRVDFSTQHGYYALAWLLRDVRANQIGMPDWRLLHLLAWMQAWLGAYGHHFCFNFHSGLRTPETNRRIEGAARASFHLPDKNAVFRAADISTPSIPNDYMGRLAQYASQGGVGFYPSSNFTHVDTGHVRAWVSRKK